MYIILGNPIPLARARLTRDRVFDPQKQLKLITGINLRTQHDERPLYHGPLHLDVVFFMPRAISNKAKSSYHSYKPDLDNLVKWICDISTTILFDDDCIISKITASKVYDKNPRTEFTLVSL